MELKVRRRYLPTIGMIDILENELYRRGYKYTHDYSKTFFGLYLDKKLIGCAYLYEGDLLFDNPSRIYDFAIDSNYQNKGYGRYLAKYLVDKYKHLYVHHIDSSIKFWESVGFKINSHDKYVMVNFDPTIYD